MISAGQPQQRLPPRRALTDQAFYRASGAPLIEGNKVLLLKDAQENYPAWLDAIRAAKRYIHFESYIIHEDDAGEMFAKALIAKAQEGVRVRVVYDWMGGFGKTSRRFWNRLRAGGVKVRCFNPPRLDSPFGWVSRDHRKSLSVDGHVGFVTGCAPDGCGSVILKRTLNRGVIPEFRYSALRCRNDIIRASVASRSKRRRRCAPTCPECN